MYRVLCLTGLIFERNSYLEFSVILVLCSPSFPRNKTETKHIKGWTHPDGGCAAGALRFNHLIISALISNYKYLIPICFNLFLFSPDATPPRYPRRAHKETKRAKTAGVRALGAFLKADCFEKGRESMAEKKWMRRAEDLSKRKR